MEDISISELRTLEEDIKNEVALRPVPVDSILQELQNLHNNKKDAVVDRIAALLQGALLETGDLDGLVKYFARQAEWRGDTTVFGTVIASILRKTTKDRLLLSFIDSAKFGTIPPSKSLARFDLLRKMKVGDYFYNKDWGFGIVRRIDGFYKRIVFDFTSRRGHAMAMDYAADILAPVGKDHILALQHEDNDRLQTLVRENPAEVVKMALKSFGPLSIARLQDLLEKYGIIEKDAKKSSWKSFWERARPGLKHDKKIVIPVKRSDPIKIRETDLDYSDEWFRDELAFERNIPKIFQDVLGFESSISARQGKKPAKEAKEGGEPAKEAKEGGEPANEAKEELSAESRRILTDRMNFAIDGAFLYPPPMFTRLVLMAQRLDIDTPRSELCDKLLDDERYMEAGDKLSSNESKDLIEFIIQERPEMVRALLDNVPRMSFNLTSQTLDVLRSMPDYQPAVKDRVRELLAATAIPPTLLVWAIRNWDSFDTSWGLPELYELMEHAIAIGEKHNLGGEQLRMQHLLVSFYKDERWFAKSFESLNDLQREALFYRIYDNAELGEPKLVRSLVDAMIRIAPVLASKKITKAEKKVEAPVQHFTSWRSLRIRQEEYRVLVEVEIPKNRDDISNARSLGDLRENFEYQSARDKQRVLTARREDYATDLETMRGTDFAEADTSRVGMGTEVTLVYQDGAEKTYAILGEWDSDDALSIIPNRSQLAIKLAGKHAGETASIPAANGGEQQVTVKAVAPLRDEVRAWANANPVPAAPASASASDEE